MKFIKTKNIIRGKTSREVANYFGLTTLAILNWRKKGCPCDVIPMPGEKGNRITYRYNVHELEHWYKCYINTTFGKGRPKKLIKRKRK